MDFLILQWLLQLLQRLLGWTVNGEITAAHFLVWARFFAHATLWTVSWNEYNNSKSMLLQTRGVFTLITFTGLWVQVHQNPGTGSSGAKTSLVFLRSESLLSAVPLNIGNNVINNSNRHAANVWAELDVDQSSFLCASCGGQQHNLQSNVFYLMSFFLPLA